MNEFNRNLINIDDLIKGGEREYIKEYITGLHPADIADIIKTLDEDKKREIFNLLHAEVASRVIVEIDDRSREQILEDINRERLVDIVGVMDSDKAADLIADLPQDNAEKILENLPWKDSAEVQKLLKYSEDTAGGIMHTELLSVREEVLVEDAIIQFMAISEEIGNIHDTFIIDKNRQLVGVMPVRKLLLIKPETPISRVMDRHIISVNVHTDQEEVARVFKKYDLVSLAVVDKEDRLMGRILIDDIVDVLIEEASEDMLHKICQNTTAVACNKSCHCNSCGICCRVISGYASGYGDIGNVHAYCSWHGRQRRDPGSGSNCKRYCTWRA